ncbi:MAG TPA: glycine cleavage system aminomethyltransferase GcvT [Acidothermaceae bacterium]|jgi:aminomethyltransferase
MTDRPEHTASVDDLLRSPLHDRHLALGAKMGEFGGWTMPLEYAGGGVIAEHNAVRANVGIFDVSHLGKASVRGPGAAAFIDATLTNDLSRISSMEYTHGARGAQYTLCADDASGGVVDDLIVYLRGDDDVFLVPNAANTAEVVRRLATAAPDDIEVRNLHRDFAVLAVQGPRSPELIDAIGLPSKHPYMSFIDSVWTSNAGVSTDITVCRSGYTGERGYELVVPSADAGAVWDQLFAAGAPLDVRACGLGARDTLRTEMGYPLHGQDLSLDITPNQARVGWAVGWKKPAFWGRDVLLAERAAGPSRILRGLESLDRGIPRPHMTVKSPDGEVVGEVTSGTFSPTRRVGIALALLRPDIVEGDEVEVDVRGRPSTMRVVKPPFIEGSRAV